MAYEPTAATISQAAEIRSSRARAMTPHAMAPTIATAVQITIDRVRDFVFTGSSRVAPNSGFSRSEAQANARASAREPGPQTGPGVYSCPAGLTLPYNTGEVVRHAPETIRLLGGGLSLDFANSVGWTADGTPLPATDALRELDSLERWGERVGVAGSAGGTDELRIARDLRGALHAIFSGLACGDEPDRFSLSRLRFAYAQAVAAGRLVAREDCGFGLDWPRDEPRRVRFAVAADAVALLADPARLARLRRCPGRDCGWVFLDTSGRRRWCSMGTCGSREKMRRLYQRRRAAELGPVANA